MDNDRTPWPNGLNDSIIGPESQITHLQLLEGPNLDLTHL